MNSSSYLEAFLTVYGWMMYDIIYQLLSMTWLIFLPLLIHFYYVFFDVISDANRGGYAHFKKGFFSFCFMLLIILTCVVPLDSITLKESKVNAVCTDGAKVNDLYNKGKSKGLYRFNEEEGKIPLLPSLVLRIAQGTNNVLFRNIPCLSSVSKMTLAFKSTEIKDPGVLAEADRFLNECVKPAKDRMINLNTSTGSQFVERLAKYYADKNDTSIAFEKTFIGSKTMQFLMNGGAGEAAALNAAIGNASSSEVRRQWNKVISPVSGSPIVLYSKASVEGVKTDHPKSTEGQRLNGGGPVSCSNWWTNNLRQKMLDSSYTDAVYKAVIADKKISKGCSNLVSPNRGTFIRGCNEFDKYHNATDADKKERLGDRLIYTAQTNFTGNIALSNTEVNVLAGAAALGVIGSIVSIFVPSADVLSSITNSATAFYGEMFMYKIIIKFLHPMLMMGIFALWAIFLVIAVYKGEVVFKGLVLLFAFSILPGIWGIADHLDGYLFQALYPDLDITGTVQKGGLLIERMVLDGASTFFYIIFPFILLYLISEAGGPRGDKGFGNTNSASNQMGSKAGRSAGSATGSVTHGSTGRKK